MFRPECVYLGSGTVNFHNRCIGYFIPKITQFNVKTVFTGFKFPKKILSDFENKIIDLEDVIDEAVVVSVPAFHMCQSKRPVK